jgi:phospholipase C
MTDRNIDHVVVLMLENRSFDHMLGFLDHPRADFPRLEPGQYPNRRNPADPTSPAAGVSADAAYTLEVDPPHSHKSVMEQLNLRRGTRAQMDGFVAAYVRKASGNDERPVVHWWRLAGLGGLVIGVVVCLFRRLLGGTGRVWSLVTASLGGAMSWLLVRAKRKIDNPESTEVGADVMRCMAPERIPVLATLAKEFAVCTRWHCSVPGETWPNRNFVHAATSEQTVDIELGLYESPTIFDTLERHGATWRVYHDGRAHLWAFRNLWHGARIARWDSMSSFEDHAAKGDLAAYSFIEPDHQGSDSSSQHPGNNGPETGGLDFVRGEQLTAYVYDVLRRHPEVFARTLLVITYDEHGGLFDHVPPPRRVPAPAPLRRERLTLARLTRLFVAFFIERRSARFRFRMLGPRVPAVVVSPLIPAGTVDSDVRDHCSVTATLRHVFAPGAPSLTARDEWARPLDHLASLAVPRGDSELPHVSPPPPETTPTTDRPMTPVPPSAPTAGEPDEFTRQLEVVARLVDAELDAMGVHAPGTPPGIEPAGVWPGMDHEDETVRRFRLAAEEARQVNP